LSWKCPSLAVDDLRYHFSPDISDRPESLLEPPEGDDDFLFDSNRHYLEQLAEYKARKQADRGAGPGDDDGDREEGEDED
jgi:hypothetical protein